MASSTGNIVVALIAGAAVGVGVGILLAPDKGSKTRQKLKDGFNSSKDDVIDKLSELLGGVKSATADAASDLEEALSKAIPKTKKDTEGLITLLEQKLEALKTGK